MLFPMSDINHTWPLPDPWPRIAHGIVHLWRAPLDAPEAIVDELFATLSADERQRAARFRFDRHRRRFIVCRGQLRRLLGRYLGESPDRIGFEYTSLGKPKLAAPWNDGSIQFSVSNSHELALFAVAGDYELGTDVERIRPLSNIDAITQRCFAPQERDALGRLPAEQRLIGFFHCWTRKEAILKAVGTGLTFPLDRLAVSLTPGAPAELLAFDDDAQALDRWWLVSLVPAGGYVAAVASTGLEPKLSCWTCLP
jgi:4'-phosphopantetheinyl transferase